MAEKADERAEGRHEPAPRPGPRWFDHGLSAVNAVIGDYLHATKNGLGIEMALQQHGRPLVLETEALRAAFPAATPRLCVLVHGLGCNEGIWQYRDDRSLDYGGQLAAEFGVVPISLRYNSGRHISENGQALAALLETLCRAFPVAVTELSLLGHSMGGLVARAACEEGARQGHAWVRHVARVITLGAPHHGAPLEKFGNALAGLLLRIPHATAQVPAEVINVRSAGVKDLRYGYTREEDWTGRDPDELLTDRRGPVTSLAHARYYVVAGSLSQDIDGWLARALGDSLVPRASAFAHAKAPGRGLPIPPARQCCLPGLGHNTLAHHPAVYAQLRRWFAEPSEETCDE